MASTINSLSDDLLREIFLRLPSLATLVRAACTCRLWYTLVASSRDFRDRFRKLSPAALLGLFFEPPSPHVCPAIPSFAPARWDDPDLAAAVLSGDFFLTALQVRPHDTPCWSVVDARCGHLLLMNRNDCKLAVLNPLARRCEGYFDLKALDFLEVDHPAILEARLICDDEHPTMFRIFCLVHDESRVRAAIFTSDIEQAFILPWLQVPAWSDPEGNVIFWLKEGMQAGGFIYWPYRDHKYVVILDTGSENLGLHVEKIPPSLCLDQFQSYMLGETKDRNICIAYANGFTVGVMLLPGGDDGSVAGTWVRSKEFNLEAVVRDMMELPEDFGELVLGAIRDGFVYFTTSRMYHRPEIPCWYGSLCLETEKVEVLFQRANDALFQPYHMPWPRFLLGDCEVLTIGDASDAMDI